MGCHGFAKTPETEKSDGHARTAPTQCFSCCFFFSIKLCFGQATSPSGTVRLEEKKLKEKKWRSQPQGEEGGGSRDSFTTAGFFAYAQVLQENSTRFTFRIIYLYTSDYKCMCLFDQSFSRGVKIIVTLFRATPHCGQLIAKMKWSPLNSKISTLQYGTSAVEISEKCLNVGERLKKKEHTIFKKY